MSWLGSLLGGNSSSSAQATTTSSVANYTNTQNTDNRVSNQYADSSVHTSLSSSLGAGAISAGGNVSILDGGAVSKSLDLADSLSTAFAAGTTQTVGKALDLAGSISASDQSFLSGVLSKAFQAQSNADALVANAYADSHGQSQSTNWVVMIALGASALVAIAALRK